MTLLFVIANTLILNHVLTVQEALQQIASAMLSAGFGPVVSLTVVSIILLIWGHFMQQFGLLVIVAPLVSLITIQLGIELIYLGIIILPKVEIGMITPPVGLNLLVTSGVAEMLTIGCYERRWRFSQCCLFFYCCDLRVGPVHLFDKNFYEAETNYQINLPIKVRLENRLCAAPINRLGVTIWCYLYQTSPSRAPGFRF